MLEHTADEAYQWRLPEIQNLLRDSPISERWAAKGFTHATSVEHSQV